MTDGKNLVQHVKERRLRVPAELFVALGPHFNRVARILDIGMDGLTFLYLDSTQLSDKTFKLDIFSTDSDFYLEEVPCKTMSDLKTYASPFSSMAMRECAVQFGGLTSRQRSQLEHFIRERTEANTM